MVDLLVPSRHTQTSIVIPAPLAEVWRALADLDEYPRWNPLIRLRPWNRAGLREGGRAWLTLSLSKLPVLVPVLVEVASGEELRWIGGPPGLFRGSHYFRLREVEGGTELIHGEDFRGLLLPLMWPVMEGQLDRMYRQVNESLATHVAAWRS
jgi:hypothetical protein